jgi:drug/metabolite transporter (DMT)-like permease
VASRRLPIPLVLLAFQLAGLVFVTAVLVLRWQGPPGSVHLLYGFLAGVAGAIGLGALYRAMAIGAISIVTPIAATSAIVPVAVGFAHGDRPSTVQDLGFVLAFVGVVLASREEVHEARTDTRIAAGVGWALFSALCFGSSLVGLHAAAAGGGDALWGTMMLRIAGIAVAVVFVAATRTRVLGRSRELVRLSPIGILDSCGVLAFSLASTRGLISVVSVLSSLFPVVAVALATIVLHERISRLQAVGVTAAICGAAALAAG